MAKICSITGRRTSTGNNVSHANNRTRRKYVSNIKTKKFYVPSLGKFVKMKVSCKGIKIINKIGVDKAIKQSKSLAQ